MELDNIIKSLKVICEQNDMKDVGSDMLLDCAVRIMNTSKINKASGELGATDKQKETLQKFNIEFKDDISKKDASDLISKKIASFS